MLGRPDNRMAPWNHASSPAPMTARPGRPLAGRVRVPGDKSISHRALILGALAVGRTRISGLLEGEDVLNTAKAMQALAARVERIAEGAWQVDGVGVAGFSSPYGPPDFGNFRPRCRLAMGGGAGCPIAVTFAGAASLRQTPMRPPLAPTPPSPPPGPPLGAGEGPHPGGGGAPGWGGGGSAGGGGGPGPPPAGPRARGGGGGRRPTAPPP